MVLLSHTLLPFHSSVTVQNVYDCIFQDDKDLVHEFVVAEGLTCLIKVGAEADQNYQNYILRGTYTAEQHISALVN